MPNIFDGFLNQALQGDTIKDYKHASRLFVDNNYELSPKYSWLFHVFFDLNPEVVDRATIDQQRQIEAGMLVKSIDLPKFRADTKIYNNYNRPHIAQSKMRYEDINIVFHDDSANVIRKLWFDYYNYYYRDMENNYGDSTGALNDVYKKSNKHILGQRALYNKFGYSLRTDSANTTQYIQAIRIYSLHQKRFSEYTLINPIINTMRHGSHQTGQDSTLEHTMTISYETVLYAGGAASVARGFADLHYDKSPSPLTVAGGGTNSILGAGGIVSALDEVITDGAGGKWGSSAFKLVRGFQKNKNVDFVNLAKGELVQGFTNLLRASESGGGENRPAENAIYIPYRGVSASVGTGTSSGLATQTTAAAGSVASNGFSLTAAAAAVTGGIQSVLSGNPIAAVDSAISGLTKSASGLITGGDPNKIIALDSSGSGLSAAASTPIPTNAFTSAIQSANDRLKSIANSDIVKTAQEGLSSATNFLRSPVQSLTNAFQTGTQNLAGAAGNPLNNTPFKNLQIPASVQVAADAASNNLIPKNIFSNFPIPKSTNAEGGNT